MASGSQMCKGNMALLPAPPMNMSTKAVGMMNPPAVMALSMLPGMNGVVPTPITISVPWSENQKLNESVK